MTTMEEEKKTRVMELMIRLKRLNRAYQLADEETRGRLLSAASGLFDSLVAEGYRRDFVETLLICGKEFLDTLYPKETADKTEASYEDIKIMFS